MMVPKKRAKEKHIGTQWLSAQESILTHWPVRLAIALLILAILTGIGSLIDTNQSTAARIARTGVVRIGYAVEPPFAFEETQGRVGGESPEVARAVWQQLGIQHIEWVRTDFASLIPQLCAGRFDQIASGLFIRPDRQKQVSFTSPSLCVEPALLVRRGNPLDLHSYRDIALHEGVRLAVIHGAVEQNEAQHAGVPAERIIAYPNMELALQAIRSGLADGLSLSAPTIRRLAAANPDLQRVLPFAAAYSPPGCGAFAFRKQDNKLRLQFDQALHIFLGSHQHVLLLQSLGLDPEDLPGASDLRQRGNH
ncbi:MAG: ectoine/hydroxyectoine ABC transporter substrate-binding protein EhuB [Desulfobulbus sp.]|nr:ectoine/hydroxyectoine ABC transporter substrate-binding protein EhuB [Desulfobulbus sp.]